MKVGKKHWCKGNWYNIELSFSVPEVNAISENISVHESCTAKPAFLVFTEIEFSFHCGTHSRINGSKIS